MTRAAVALDVTDKAQIAAAVAEAEAAYGGIDVLVNNAGYGYLAAVEEGDDAEIRDTVRHQLLRGGRHAEGRAARYAGPGDGAHREHRR